MGHGPLHLTQAMSVQDQCSGRQVNPARNPAHWLELGQDLILYRLRRLTFDREHRRKASVFLLLFHVTKIRVQKFPARFARQKLTTSDTSFGVCGDFSFFIGVNFFFFLEFF